MPTPKHIATKKAVVNINSLDNYCFQYSVLAGMNLVSINSNYRKDRAGIYKPFMHLLNMDGIQSPVSISSIGKFESQNPDISVNVLYHDVRHLLISENIMLLFLWLPMIIKDFITFQHKVCLDW